MIIQASGDRHESKDFKTFEEAYETLKTENFDKEVKGIQIEGYGIAPIIINYPGFDIVCMHGHEEEYIGKLWCADCGEMTSPCANLISYGNMKSGHTFKTKKKRIKK